MRVIAPPGEDFSMLMGTGGWRPLKTGWQAQFGEVINNDRRLLQSNDKEGARAGTSAPQAGCRKNLSKKTPLF